MSDDASTNSPAAELTAYLGKDVVLDTRGELLYIGRLEHVGEWFLTLVDADVHDLSESRTRKDVYLIEAARFGVKKNRHQVMVRTREVVSLSTLEQVIVY
jgi:small nuclear ribonucleoprotein (snRNP)-like protein